MSRDESDPERRQIPVAAALEVEAATAQAPEGQADAGQLEAQSLSRGLTPRDLKREADERDHDRSQLFKEHFELMAIVTFWVLFGVFMIVGVIWALHLVAPQWGWLSHDQTDDLQGLLTGGVIAGVLADHVRRRMS